MRKTTTATEAVFWRLPAVCDFLQFSRSTLLRRVAAGEFPRPVKLGPNSIAWPADDVRAWASARIAARDGRAA